MTNQKLPSFTHHYELRRDVSLDCSEPVLTDQSFKNACDINNIMAQYAKTGMLPAESLSVPRFIDNTQIPTLEHAFDIVRTAENMFYDLPATVRKLMDNDPSQLENFINDPKNHEILVAEGLVIAKTETDVAQSNLTITSPLNNEQITKKETL